ncbi:hypothetical protein FOFC_21004 [Fusarium oxysporum]|nr:hypothetical protein FocnCong_v011369 [Fusarium oxysporum f. sp. conglutinans]KAI8396456.1 hypothetical protein FOFC_21004 [Fusarium oxysporum]
MSHHENGDVSRAVSDTTNVLAPLNFDNKASKKRNATTPSRYKKKKDDILKELSRMTSGCWPSIENTVSSLGGPTLEVVYTVVKSVQEEGIDERDLFKNEAKYNHAVKKGVYAILGKSDPEQGKAGSDTTIEASSATGTEITVGSDAQNTVGADFGVHIPSPPSPQQSQSSGTSPSGRPKKKRKPNGDYVDITAQSSSEDKELERQNTLVSVAKRAKVIYTQLKGNERLNDDTIYIISQAFQLAFTRNPPPRILDTMLFKIDEEKIPSQLKHTPKSGELVYVPLHHQSSEHWTSCVLLFDYELGSKVDSIRLNFYDSSKTDVRAEKVKAFFTKWTKECYPGSKFTFDQKETAQQNDKTSCGVFVLETIRRLIALDDVTRTIEPRDAKKRFLDMVASINTGSPSPSTDLQVMEEIKALERNCVTSAIMDGSPSITQQPMGIRLSQETITKIKNLCESEGMPIAERLSLAKTELKWITEEEERLKIELTGARKELDCANVNMLATEDVLATFLQSITMDETAGGASSGVHLQITKDETMSDGTPSMNSLAKNPCSNDMLDAFSCMVKNAASGLMQAERARIKDKLAEATDKARREVENAEKKVGRITERKTHLLREKGLLDAEISLHESLSHLASDGGDKLTDESLSAT